MRVFKSTYRDRKGRKRATAKWYAHGVNERPKVVPVVHIDFDAPDPGYTGDNLTPIDDDNTDAGTEGGTSITGPGDIEDTPLEPGPCAADLTDDGMVDVLDLVAVFENWGACEGACVADTNGDQVVDVMDLIEVVSAWGTCAP